MPNFENVRNKLMSESRFMAWCQTATPKEHELSNRVIIALPSPFVKAFPQNFTLISLLTMLYNGFILEQEGSYAGFH